MSYPTEPLREHPSAYFVQDRENLEEMARLEIQDRMITAGMGGVLPELADHSHLRRVLDVGCGTGGWLMEVARTYPSIEKLFGGDISGKMVEYARTQAESQHLSSRVQFQTMDALRALSFPDGFFDLVNQRLGASWLRTWEWMKILLEYQRVVRSGGIIRITEAGLVESNSPALTTLCDLALDACIYSGRFFEQRSDGVICKIAHLMTVYGIEEVQRRDHTLVFQSGTSEHLRFVEDMTRLFRVSLPFFQKWIYVPNDYEEIYQQAKKEMQQPDFVATWQFRTAWGIRSVPKNGGVLLMRGLP
jgi:ubiquinone/menaquinone biosynthesis C-methylase UbiE